MTLDITNSTHEFNELISQFVSEGKIIPEKIESIDDNLKIINDYKKYFANSERKPMDIVKIYSGLNLMENFFIFSKLHLLEGVRKKENPKSAKDIIKFREDIVSIANQIDEFKLESKKDIPNNINAQAMELRERLRNEELYPKIETIDKKVDDTGKNIQDIFIAGMKDF